MLSPQVHLYRLLHRKDLSPTKRDNSSFERIGKVETTASKRLNRLHVQLVLKCLAPQLLLLLLRILKKVFAERPGDATKHQCW